MPTHRWRRQRAVASNERIRMAQFVCNSHVQSLTSPATGVVHPPRAATLFFASSRSASPIGPRDAAVCRLFWCWSRQAPLALTAIAPIARSHPQDAHP